MDNKKIVQAIEYFHEKIESDNIENSEQSKAYNTALTMLETVLRKQTRRLVVNKRFQYDGEYGNCPYCKTTVHDYYDFKICRNCEQSLSWK